MQKCHRDRELAPHASRELAPKAGPGIGKADPFEQLSRPVGELRPNYAIGAT